MKKINFLLLLFFIIPVSAYIFSQSSLPAGNTELHNGFFQIIGNDLKDFYKDGINLYTSPFHYNTKDAILAGGVIVTTAGFLALDEPLKKFIQKQKSEFNTNISKVAKQYGEFYMPLIIGGSLYSYGMIFDNEHTRVTGRMVLEAAAFSGLLVTLMKMTTGRSRPYTDEGTYKFNWFKTDEGHLSFPSGHSAVAFSISSVLANRINNTYASIGLYILSSLTALSRVYDNQHWISDVFLGSAIGFFTGKFISKSSVTVKNSDSKITTLDVTRELNFRYNLFTINF
jgi:hypothetical protein